MKVSKTYPLMPLRDIVVLPGMIIPLFVGREASINALDYAVKNNTKIFLSTQLDPTTENPSIDDIYDIGVIANVLQIIRLPDKTVKILIEAIEVKKLKSLKKCDNNFFEAEIVSSDMVNNFRGSKKLEDTIRMVKSYFKEYAKTNHKINDEILSSISSSSNDDIIKTSYLISSQLDIDTDKKQEILQQTKLKNLLELLLVYLKSEISVKKTDKKIQERVKKQMDKNQREYYLNEKIKAINEELGNSNSETIEEINQLKSKIQESGMPIESQEKLLKELKKLKSMPPSSAESNVIKTYIDTALDLPWTEKTKVKNNIQQSEKVLEEDHYGLEEVKTRVLEYLGVQKRVGKLKSPILCLVGPPGVGKTSLGQSIAKATNRKFVRMALGGVHDEAEIRGHRKTYIGSMPGKIINNMIKVGVKNPLFLLDEIDKISQDFRGDPASALLEVLDPEQNSKFNDHYLEIDYDLSEVMFVATSNSMNIPAPLLDRMEVIRIAGYTEDEKLNIAKKHLIKKQLEENGLQKNEFKINDSAIRDVIQSYTREAGVRNLEREIAKLMRKSVVEIDSNKDIKNISVNKKNIENFLGVHKFTHNSISKKNQIGQVNGLAWTSVGGEILTIEAIVVKGKGKITLTGKLGEVMQESIQAALTVVRSRSQSLGIDDDFYEKHDIHVHVPEGATPKDGPSAGIGMCTALISALTNINVNSKVAMTGEITLRGEVLAIGGLKEKLLAAHRSGIKLVIIPKDNEKDLKDIPENILEGIDILAVKWIDDVITHSLTKTPKPKLATNNKSSKSKEDNSSLRAH